MKTESMSIKEFMNREKDMSKGHFEKYGVYYKAAGISLIILSTGDISFAAGIDPIGPAARGLYSQLVGIGKWIIIFKGGFETIKSIGNGDVDSAKKDFFRLSIKLFVFAGLTVWNG